MSDQSRVLDVAEDRSIRRHQIANRLTSVERRLMRHFSTHRSLVVCVGNIGAGKSSLVKLLAFNTGLNALFELPDEGFEDHIPENEALCLLLSTAKGMVKRTLGEYYGGINDFIATQQRGVPEGTPEWAAAKRRLEKGALDIQHAYLDLRRMQLQAVPSLSRSTVVDGSPLADRFAFCEVLHRDLDIDYLSADGLAAIDRRLEDEFRTLARPDLLILLHGPLKDLYRNIGDRSRQEEQAATDEGPALPEGLQRLVRGLSGRYDAFVDVLQQRGWYDGPVLRIDVSKLDFVSNVRHLIAVYEAVERLVSPGEQLGLFPGGG
jgi:deoxyadenosine/deoxycytidine kinase